MGIPLEILKQYSKNNDFRATNCKTLQKDPQKKLNI